jgi:hypothetical protein
MRELNLASKEKPGVDAQLKNEMKPIFLNS